MPTEEASAEVAADVEVPGPRSRGSSDTVSPTVITLPSSAWRRVADEIDWVASLEPDTVTDRAPYTVTGATITVLVSRRPALDSVTSSSRAVPVGVPGGATPTTAAVVRAPGEGDRVPLPKAKGGNGFGMQPDHAAAVVQRRGVQPGGQSQMGERRSRPRRIRSPVIVTRPGLRSPRRATERRCGWARRVARRVRARRCRGLSSHASGWAATQRLAADRERDVDDVGQDDRQDHEVAVEDRRGDADREQHQQRHHRVRRHGERVHLAHRDAADRPAATPRSSRSRRPVPTSTSPRRTASWPPAGRSRRSRPAGAGIPTKNSFV